DEQEQHDAELGHLADVRHVADEVEAPRPDDEPGGDVAKDRGQPEEAEQRHRDHGGGEQDRGLREGNHELEDSGRKPARRSPLSLPQAVPMPAPCSICPPPSLKPLPIRIPWMPIPPPWSARSMRWGRPL